MTTPASAAILDKPWQIHLFRLKTLQRRLELEIKGLMSKGRPTLAILREEGITAARTRKRALIDLKAHIADTQAGYGILCTMCREDRPTQGITGHTGQYLVLVCDRDTCAERALHDAGTTWDQPNG